MDQSSDLVEHFKLDAELLTEYTQHSYYKSDRSSGRRKVNIVKRWRKKHDIGEGNFGTVWLEVEDDGTERAVKAISKRLCSHNSVDYRKELLAMARLSKYEELFVVFQGWFEDTAHIFIAMEYFKHGDLQRYMDEPMPELQVKIITLQILEGLKTMHQLGFTHRDLKPQASLLSHSAYSPNIFVVDTVPSFWVKIGDFGITKRVLNEQTFLRTEIGTREYLAPEVLGYVDEETSKYTNAVDLWSLGCVCHRLLTMKPPFEKIMALAPYCLGKRQLPIEALPEATVSEEAVTFVKDLMAAQPSERLNAEKALESTWLRDVDSPDDVTGERTTVLSNNFQTSPSASKDNHINPKGLENFLKAGFDLKDYRVEREGYATRAFEWAARQPTTDNLTFLLQSPAIIDVRESLYWAIRENIPGVVQVVLNLTGIDINISGTQGLTPLHWACIYGHEGIARYLLEEGANANAVDKLYMTPLHCTPRADLIAGGPISKLLEEYGADRSSKDCDGRTPLATAPAVIERTLPEPDSLFYELLSLELDTTSGSVATLQELAADDLSPDQWLQGRFRRACHGHPPHVAAKRAFEWASKQRDRELMDYILDRALVTLKKDLNDLLSQAVSQGQPEAIGLLLRYGA